MRSIIANFKMNPERLEDMEQWLGVFERSLAAKRKKSGALEVVLCPPFVWLSTVVARIRQQKGGVKRDRIPTTSYQLGAQNVFWEEKGAFTGEISPTMLNDLGVEYVIIGHSERRALGETDDVINKKIKAALRAGLTVILAVGESIRVDEERAHERDVGTVVEEEIARALAGVPKTKLPNILIAYEPLWAVGSGIADTPEDALKAAMLIRKCVAKISGLTRARARELRVLYGGSVTAANAARFLREEGLDGVLVGGASLNAREFAAIIEQAREL